MKNVAGVCQTGGDVVGFDCGVTSGAPVNATARGLLTHRRKRMVHTEVCRKNGKSRLLGELIDQSGHGFVDLRLSAKRFSAAMTKASLAIERLGTALKSRAAETEIVRIVRQRQKKDRFRGIQRRRWA